MKNRYSFIICLTISVLTAGCAELPLVASLVQISDKVVNSVLLGPTLTNLGKISVDSSSDMNNHQAIKLHVVFVLNQNIVKKMPFNAVGWFDNEAQYVLQMSDDIILLRLHIPPGYAGKNIKLPKNYHKAVKVFLYANYVNPKAQLAMDITKFYALKINLARESVNLTEIPQSFWEKIL